MMTYRNTLIALAIVASCSTAATAQDVFVKGQPVDATTGSTTIVNYSDIDLASTAGADQLRQRVKQAVASVCSHDYLVYRDFKAVRWCVNQTSARMAPQLNQVLARAGGSPTLAAASLVVTAAR